MFKKIFPFGAGLPPDSSFKIFIVSEGYVAGKRADFYNACNLFINNFFNAYPFSGIDRSLTSISIYAHFEASANAGPSMNAPAAPGRTLFDTSMNSGAELLSLNKTKINDKLNSLSLKYDGADIQASTLLSTKGPVSGGAGALTVILLPPTAGNGGEYEHEPQAGDYYFVATTQNNRWYQVIIRGVAKAIGLGDEFDLPGNNFLEPVGENIILFAHGYPNLVYFDSVPLMPPSNNFKWKNKLSVVQQLAPLEIVRHPGNAATIDRTLDTSFTSPDLIKLYEGGGGYRTKVYRSSRDCILRRKIGDISLPLRKQEIQLCPICSEFIYHAFK